MVYGLPGLEQQQALAYRPTRWQRIKARAWAALPYVQALGFVFAAASLVVGACALAYLEHAGR